MVYITNQRTGYLGEIGDKRLLGVLRVELIRGSAQCLCACPDKLLRYLGVRTERDQRHDGERDTKSVNGTSGYSFEWKRGVSSRVEFLK